MFFIINKTKGPLTFEDINIRLGPRQAIDLDKVVDRKISENSACLIAAKKKGSIEIRIKDSGKLIPNTSDIILEEESVKNNPDINDIKQDIISELKNEIRSLKLIDKPSNGISKEELVDVMKELIQNMPAKEVIIREGENKIINNEEKVEINNDLLIEINKRAVEKMTKNTKTGEIKYKEEKQKDDITSNIEELENLLGN